MNAREMAIARAADFLESVPLETEEDAREAGQIAIQLRAFLSKAAPTPPTVTAAEHAAALKWEACTCSHAGADPYCRVHWSENEEPDLPDYGPPGPRAVVIEWP